MIKQVKISGFRSVNEELTLDLSNITALVGPNNSGKSNILLALYKTLGRDWVTANTFDEKDIYQQDPEKDIEIRVILDKPLKYHPFKDSDPVDVGQLFYKLTRYKIGVNKGGKRLEKCCLDDDGKTISVLQQRPKKGEQHQYGPLLGIPQEIVDQIPLIYIGARRDLRYHLPSSKGSLLRILMEDVNKSFKKDTVLINHVNSKGEEKSLTKQQKFNACIEEALKTLRTDDFEELEKLIKDNALLQLGLKPENAQDIDIFFSPLSSEQFYNSLELFVEENDYMINATELGGGFQNALVMAIVKAFEEKKKTGAVFLIEEPEMFLHPQMQRNLYRTIRNLGKTNQIIYATHSPYFVNVANFDEVIVIRKDNEGTNKTKSDITDKNLANKFRKDLKAERNELFFASKVLFVEGDTEEGALPQYAKRLKFNYDRNGGSIIEVGGKRNLKDYVELVLSFKIPVGFIYDIDSSDIDDEKEEKEYNQLLEKYKAKDVKVWKLDKKYEDELKNFYGEEVYQGLCQKYGKNKTIRARLIAQDKELKIPEFVKKPLEWLSN